MAIRISKLVKKSESNDGMLGILAENDLNPSKRKFENGHAIDFLSKHAQPLIIRYFCFDNSKKGTLSGHLRCQKIVKNFALIINEINVIRAKYQNLQRSDIQYHKGFTQSKTWNMPYVFVSALRTLNFNQET